MSNRKQLPGKFVWFELVSSEPKKAQAFYGEVLGWKVQPFPMGPFTYEMILAGDTLDTMIGGYATPRGNREPSRWIASVSVDDVDATIARARNHGAKIPMDAEDIPGIGRFGVLQDPTGATLAIMKPLPREKQG